MKVCIDPGHCSYGADTGAEMAYTKHLCANWRVAAHAAKDCLAHFIHGIVPPIKIRHHQPVKK